MKMKKIIISIVVLILALPGFSQQADPEARAKELTKKMKEIIQFSDQQEKAVYNLNLDFGKKRGELRKNQKGDSDAIKEEMKKMSADYEASLKKILDEKQFKKYLEEKENIMARPSGQGKGRPAQGAGKK
jgi:PBP1b-binding outer membrane lipoprotein LpoB